jgi:hypothetical protein
MNQNNCKNQEHQRRRYQFLASDREIIQTHDVTGDVVHDVPDVHVGHGFEVYAFDFLADGGVDH